MSTLRTPRKYKGKPFKIPFSVSEKGSTRYKVKLQIDSATANFGRDEAIEEALDHYIIHYFPEFYTALYNESAFLADNSGDDAQAGIVMLASYAKLRDALRPKIKIATHYPTSPPSAKEVMVFSLRYDIFKTRDRLTKRKFNGETEQQQMPSFEASLQYFNGENGVGPTEAQTEFLIKKMATTSKSLQGAFTKFGKQQKRSNGPRVPMPMDFGFLGRSVDKVMSALADDLMLSVKGAGKAYKFREGDTLTLYFGRSDLGESSNKLVVVPKYAITDIKYLAADKSIAAEHLKIGQLSLVKYNLSLKDPVVAASLKNYESVLKMDKSASKGAQAFSVDEFFGNTFGIDISEGLPMEWNTSNDSTAEQDDENNALINTAVDLGIIDIANTAALQVSIGAYTIDQLVALNEAVTKNPALYQEVFKGQEKKKDEVSPDFVDQIQKILGEGPMAAIDDNSPIGSFFRHFGIKTLVKEALLCLTFGMNFEIARIVAIVDEIKGIAENGNIVVEFGGSVQGVTKPQISLPSLGDLSMSFPMFTLTGDIWKKILEIVIESLEKALLQIIVQLTELLRELCDFNNPRSRDYGDTNIGDLIPRAAPKENAGMSIPDMGAQHGPYDPFKGSNVEEASGMTPAEIYEYVEQLSIILSSMDVCILLTQPSVSEEDLVQKILDFNLAYDQAPQVAENLNTFTAIIGFFAELAKVVDVTDLCNEIANEVATLNQNNLCLTENDIQSINMDDMDNIETLLDILQNGLRPEIFKPDLECPESSNYIEDPTFRKSIYETLNTLVETVELQFNYSSESIKNVLLDSSLQKADGSAGSRDGAAAAIATAMPDDPLPEEWALKPSKMMINVLKGIIEALEDVGPLADQIQACINDNQDMLELDTTIDIAAIPMILEKVVEGMEIAFAAGGQLGGLVDTLGDIANSVEEGAGAPILVSRKVFNKRFLREFKDYILMSKRGEITPYARFSAMNPSPSMALSPTTFKAPSNEGGGYNFEAAGAAGKDLTWNFRTAITNPRPRAAYTVGGKTFDPAAYATARAASKFSTSDNGWIKLSYPDYQSTPSLPATSFELDALFQGTPGAGSAFSEEVSHQQAMTMDPFIDSVVATLSTGFEPPGNLLRPNYSNIVKDYAKHRVFPMANALLTDYVFDYYIKNGIFDAATLQSLNFFHDNENCAPGDASDLLDVDGIINKMLRLFEDLACGSNLPARKKVRLALKYGMYLLFVQVHIAEFVIKNIFVFSATEIDELFGKQFIALYMRAQIESSLASYLAEIDTSVRDMFVNDLTELFQELNQIQGGITDYAGNVVFNSGEELPADQATYNKIINYIVGERITDSKSAVNNAIKQAHPNANPKPLEEIFLRSIPAYETLGDGWASHGSVAECDQHLFITKSYFYIDENGDPSNTAPAAQEPAEGVHTTHLHPEVDPTFRKGDEGYFTGQYVTHENNDRSTHIFKRDHLEDGYVEHLHEGLAIGPPTWVGDVWREMTIAGMSVEPEGPGQAPPSISAAVTETQYILRYNFWLCFTDPNSPMIPREPMGGASTKLYSLLPLYDRRWSYPYQPQFFDRHLTMEPNDPILIRIDNETGAPSLGPRRDLTQEDVDFLMSVPEYQDYFTNVLNKEVISMIPIIDNFYLTTKYFDEIAGTMKTTKDACLNIVKNTIESDDKYDKTPDMSRKVANTFKMDGGFETAAREFILMMLIKTPIDIIKGLLELIDPHVAISKLIKNITGQVFNMMSTVFDELIESAEPLQELGIDSGEKLLTIVLCLVDVIMKNPPGTSISGPMAAKKEMEAFFPRISAEGIDLLGSIMGMFMIPPSPLGILYLLLSLINVEIPSFGADTGDNAVVNSEDSSKPTKC
jgi:hypothetical protein